MGAEVRHSDWKIAQRHAEIVQDLMPTGARRLQMSRNIAGVSRGRISQGFRAGNYLMPLTSESVRLFSNRHDIARKSLLVLARGTTSAQQVASSESEIGELIEKIRSEFAYRRVAMMERELHSYLQTDIEYAIDDDIARTFDVVTMVLVSVFREDR